MSDSNDLQELFSLMLQVKQAVHKMMSPTSLEERAATSLQYAVLAYLVEHPKIAMRELSEHLRLSFSSATQLIERLVKTGYVQRQDDEKDRRTVHLIITNEGKKEVQTMKKHWEEKMTSIFSHMAQKDIKEYIRLQKLILTAIQKEGYESR